MMIKTPSFWYRASDKSPEILEHVLTPLSHLYEKAVAIHRQSKNPSGVNAPVICVGNLNAGGSGKTPMALVLMQMAQQSGLFKKPVFLTRGYGGQLRGPLLFNPKHHDYKDAGDEVFLLGKVAPCIIAQDRFAGALLAKKNGADLIIMDDGLQNYSLTQDLRVIVVDGSIGFGNRKTLPAGPLREPLKSGLGKADLLILMGDDQRGVQKLFPADTPVLQACLLSQLSQDDLRRPLLAFAGLGWPDKFFDAVRVAGGDVVEVQAFPDHHRYTPQEIDGLIQRAQAKHARLITTRKDMIRIPPAYKDKGVISVAGANVTWRDAAQADDYFRGKFSDLNGLYP